MEPERSADLLNVIISSGGLLADPLSPPSSSLYPPFITLCKLGLGLFRLLWFVQRPLVVPLAIVFYLRRCKALWSRSKVLSLLVTTILGKALYGVFRDPMFVRALRRVLPHEPTAEEAIPGLFFNQQSERMSAILSRCAFATGKPYRAPSLLWNGDLTTIYYALFCRAPNIEFQRTFIPVGPEHFVLDWAFPPHVNRQTTPVMLFLPGVGGDSKVPYLLQACQKALAQGWICCVLLARGLGSSRVSDVRHIFDPSSLDDVQSAVDRIGSLFNGPIFMAGFSLGGVTVCNYLSRCSLPVDSSSPSPSGRVVAAVAVSGAFQLDFMNWWRYRSVYQAMIVPVLLLELHHKYGAQFASLFSASSQSALLSSTCYADLHRYLFTHIKQITKRESEKAEVKFDLTNPLRAFPVEFDTWKTSMEGNEHRHNIQVPFLLFTALDDPFHNADMVGIERNPANPNIAYYVTESGGHVAWPVGFSDFSYAPSVIVDFCRSAIVS